MIEIEGLAVEDVVMVLTSKALPTMVSEGGSGDWSANEDRLRRCRWLVAVRNRHSDWSEGHEDHGTAFLIGRIVGVKPGVDISERFVIVFDRYAELNLPDRWPGHRNPVAYSSLEKLGIDPAQLEWKDFPGYSKISARQFRLAESDKITLKLAFLDCLMTLTLMGSDAIGIWVDSFEFQSLISAPVYGSKEPYEIRGDGYRPSMFIPFSQVQYILREES